MVPTNALNINKIIKETSPAIANIFLLAVVVFIAKNSFISNKYLTGNPFLDTEYVG